MGSIPQLRERLLFQLSDTLFTAAHCAPGFGIRVDGRTIQAKEQAHNMVFSLRETRKQRPYCLTPIRAFRLGHNQHHRIILRATGDGLGEWQVFPCASRAIQALYSKAHRLPRLMDLGRRKVGHLRNVCVGRKPSGGLCAG